MTIDKGKTIKQPHHLLNVKAFYALLFIMRFYLVGKGNLVVINSFTKFANSMKSEVNFWHTADIQRQLRLNLIQR